MSCRSLCSVPSPVVLPKQNSVLSLPCTSFLSPKEVYAQLVGASETPFLWWASFKDAPDYYVKQILENYPILMVHSPNPTVITALLAMVSAPKITRLIFDYLQRNEEAILEILTSNNYELRRSYELLFDLVGLQEPAALLTFLTKETFPKARRGLRHHLYCFLAEQKIKPFPALITSLEQDWQNFLIETDTTDFSTADLLKAQCFLKPERGFALLVALAPYFSFTFEVKLTRISHFFSN